MSELPSPTALKADAVRVYSYSTPCVAPTLAVSVAAMVVSPRVKRTLAPASASTIIFPEPTSDLEKVKIVGSASPEANTGASGVVTSLSNALPDPLSTVVAVDTFPAASVTVTSNVLPAKVVTFASVRLYDQTPAAFVVTVSLNSTNVTVDPASAYPESVTPEANSAAFTTPSPAMVFTTGDSGFVMSISKVTAELTAPWLPPEPCTTALIE